MLSVKNLKLILCLTAIVTVTIPLHAQNSTIVVDLKKSTTKISPSLHGIFFEEISHGGEGGLYGELIQNRGFEESRIPPGCSLDTGWLTPPRTPQFGSSSGKVSEWKMKFEPADPMPSWSLVTKGNPKASIALDLQHPLNSASPQSLQLDITSITAGDKVSVVNEGFWGIRVDRGASYVLNFYLRSSTIQDVSVSLVGENGAIAASHDFKEIGNAGWAKYGCVLTANASSAKAKFYLTFSQVGTAGLDFVSLFPKKTFKNRVNGMRPDLANYLADLKPAFVRWPGGCFVEGISTESAPNWKRSLGPLEERPGTYSPWGYWSSDGIGYHEFLQFCEDIHADAMYVFNCGVACEMRSGVYLTDDKVPGLIADILDGIEYAIGPVDSKWGAVRAKNGHPKPFSLKYVEVGNEQVGERYAKRFNIFYDAIKKKYPQLEVLSAMGIAHLSKPTIQTIKKMDMADEHAYKGINWSMINSDWYDKYERSDYTLYVGEYACNSGVGNGNMMAALNDATFIMGMERNADLIKMSSYAPLLENVNDTDWPVNLIRFDNAKSFARISYYVIKMMNENRPTVNLATSVTVDPSLSVAPKYTGKIGLSTWDTQAEFKDVEISKDGKVIYKSNFATSHAEWKTEGGNWKTEGNVLAQRANGAWPMAVLDKELDTYTLKLRARKTDGPNAFMIPLAIKDNKNYLRVHIGAWWNRVSAFELVADGNDAMVTQPVKLESPLEVGRWYDVEINVESNRIECYLDGNLLMTYTEPKNFFAIAGKDETTGEVVVKVINASATACTSVIDLMNDDKKMYSCKEIILSSNSPNDENSFEHPDAFVPREGVASKVTPKFQHTFKPWSITTLRLK